MYKSDTHWSPLVFSIGTCCIMLSGFLHNILSILLLTTISLLKFKLHLKQLITFFRSMIPILCWVLMLWALY